MSAVYMVIYQYYDDWELVGLYKTRRAAIKGRENYLKKGEPYSLTFDRSFHEKHTQIDRVKVLS